MTKVAVVTGANKGIGLAIVRGLCKSFKGDVYLTSRDEKRGRDAILLLQKENLGPKFFQVDVTNKQSIVKLKEMLLSEYGGLDLLVNNAGMHFEGILSPDKVALLMETNYFGVVSMCEILFPILKRGAKIVHISSGGGNYALAESKELIENMTSTKSVEDVTRLMQMFLSDVNDGTWKEKGWFESAYSISKAGVIILTKIQQELFDSGSSKLNIIVNACSPGFVDTDMTRSLATPLGMPVISPDEGADTPLYLALLPENTENPKGCFLREKEVFSWDNDPYVDKIRKYVAATKTKKN